MKRLLSLIIGLSTLTGTIFLTWCNKQPIILQGNIIEQKNTVEQGDLVEITYTSMLKNGIPFKKTENNETLHFIVWSGEVIKGLDKGVIGMKVNEVKTLEIVPEDAYANEYNPLKIQQIARARLNSGMIDAKEWAYIKIGNVEGTIKWFIKDENGNDVVILENNPPYTYEALTYIITMKKITKNKWYELK